MSYLKQVAARLNAFSAKMKPQAQVSAPKTSALSPHGQLSEHFHADEFRCRCCGELHPLGVHPALVEHLEAVRAHFGKPVKINSGYRCPAHNKAVGGATSSKHMEGIAADHYIKGVSAALVAAFHNKRLQDGGVGKYETFTHIDVRGYKARWGF